MSGGLAETPPLNFCFPLYPKGLPFLMIESQMHFTYCHAGGIQITGISWVVGKLLLLPRWCHRGLWEEQLSSVTPPSGWSPVVEAAI